MLFQDDISLPHYWHSSICLARNVSEFLICQKKRQKKRLFYGISGDGALGKSTIAKLIKNYLPNSFIIEADGYIWGRKERLRNNIFSGDDPRAIRFNDLKMLLLNIQKETVTVEIKGYDPSAGKSYFKDQILGKSFEFYILDGTLSIYPEIKAHLDYLLFFDESY